MKTGYMILSAASIIPLLSGCASYQKSADSATWSIKPAFNVRHSAETPDAYYQLGRYYQGQSRHEQALAAYRKALAADGKFVEARNGLGVVYSMQGKFKEATEQFRLAVEQAPNAAHIHNNLGYALYLSGAYAEAASALERAVALDASNKAAYANLALALDKAGDRGKAVQVMAQAVGHQPAENMPPVDQKAPQALTGTPSPVSATAVVTTATPAPVQQPALALPKDWGVITQAVRKPVLVVENHIQAVQLEPNVYELRERVEVPVPAAVATKSLDRAPAQLKERDNIVVQTAQKPVPATESHVQAALSVSKVAEQQARATAPASKAYRIEVSNGNGVAGMARKVAGFLGEEGYSGARLTNQKTFSVPSSRIHYRQGYQDEARLLVGKMPGQPDLVQSEDMRKDISVQIVLGKDITSSVAHFEVDRKGVKLARVGSDS